MQSYEKRTSNYLVGSWAVPTPQGRTWDLEWLGFLRWREAEGRQAGEKNGNSHTLLYPLTWSVSTTQDLLSTHMPSI